MAANISEEERNIRIIFVGNYFLKNPGVSIRTATKDISDNHFKISVATVHDYLERFKKISSKNKEAIEEHINANKEESIDDESVRNRVFYNTRLCLEGYTIEEISDKTGIPYWTVYRDLIVRLPKVNMVLGQQVNKILQKNKEENLKNHKK